MKTNQEKIEKYVELCEHLVAKYKLNFEEVDGLVEALLVMKEGLK